jgi:hypothetical protein
LVDFIVGDFEDFIVGDFEESLDPLAVGLLVFLLALGPLEDFMVGPLEDFMVGDLELDLRSLAMAAAQMKAIRRKRVLMEFMVCASFV